MKYHFRIKREKKGYWGRGIELPECVTQGESIEELEKNMREALNLLLDEPPSSKMIFPLPRKKIQGRNVRAVSVEPRVALAFLLRNFRLMRKMSQKQAAQLIGVRGLYSYQRLESSKTANPEFETIIRIKKAFPELDLDDLLAA
jgi:antitoxin HicB